MSVATISTGREPTSVGSELKRLTALRRLGLLDSGPSPSFDRVTRLTAAALNVPIVLVSLVDESRQWFKSHFGIHVTETSRDVSFCSYAINNREPLIVADATADSRFANNPLVTGDPQIRFYAGIPLFTGGGFAVGTLCAIDRRPRELDYESLEVLEDFAAIAEDLISGRELAIRTERLMGYAVERGQFHEETVEAIPLGIVHASLSGKLRRANAHARQVVGIPADIFSQQSISALLHPNDWAAHSVRVQQVMSETIASYGAAMRLRRHAGGFVPALVTFALKRSSSGMPAHLLVTFDLNTVEAFGSPNEDDA